MLSSLKFVRPSPEVSVEDGIWDIALGVGKAGIGECIGGEAVASGWGAPEAYVHVCVRVCAYACVEARERCQVSWSVTLCLIPLRQGGSPNLEV